MRILLLLFFIGLFFFAPAQNKPLVYETGSFRMILGGSGQIEGLFDKQTGKNYLAPQQPSPLISIRCKGEIEIPSSVKIKGNLLIFSFVKNGIEARVKAVQGKTYLTFELVSISPDSDVELIIWGPYPTVIGESIGECVGVVHDGQFALGIQALNTKTLGGFPDEENDIEPSYDIFSTGNLSDITEDWKSKKAYRGQTARVRDFGSVLQAYCRNRSKERTLPNWGHSFYTAPAFNDGGPVGSKIALFGCPPAKVLETIGQIELAEGLPHPVIDGEWAKISKKATSSYLIVDFSEKTLNEALELTRKTGFDCLYHSGPFKTWGHFILDENKFPNGREELRQCVETAKKQGIRLGLHTLSNFITTNDAYVTPIPDKRLAKVGESVLVANVSDISDEIAIESPLFFNQMKNNSLHSVIIGNEIIRYNKVTESAPWKLTGCHRGAFGTKAEAHQKGDKIGKLMDQGYKVFLGDAGLSEEIARNIAALFNETGLEQTSFDGLEGLWSTGMGQYAQNLFTKTWYDNLKPGLKGAIINDASNPSHYNWHINTRYNWGEPWYAGFRESQTNYRLMNQDFFHRNFLPSMLGWFSLSAQTSIEDVEWLLARAAGFDAGFAFTLDFETVGKNGESELIFTAIRNWETARLSGAFSESQKQRMQNVGNEFHLEPDGEGKWGLIPYHSQHFIHRQKVRQPGEPVFSTFEFDNPYSNQTFEFIAALLPGSDGESSPSTKVVFEVNNFSRVEIPVNMEPYQILKFGCSGKISLYDKNWNLIKEIKPEGEMPVLSEGNNKIIFDAEFSRPGSSEFKLEIKTAGPSEPVILK